MERRSFVLSSFGLLAGSAVHRNIAFARAAAPQGKWVKLAPVPRANGEILGIAVNGKLYASQGLLPGFKPAGLLYEYDPAADSWSEKKAMPHPVHHAAVTAQNGKIYAIGGRLSGAFIIGFPGNTALVQVYDPATDSWATKAPMPTPRSGLNTAQLNGVIYAAGGEVQDQQYLAAFKAFEAYDPESDTWWQLPSMLLPRHECIMAAVGNRIHVAGGSVQSAIVPPPRGVSFDTDAHEAFEVASS